MYVRAGCTADFVSSIVGISQGRMSDIYHEWCNVLDDSLSAMFPRPTRSQMLRAYPQRTVEGDGHARNWLLLDAVEIFAQKSSNNNVASATHSDYKKHTTVKFLAACDPIGYVWPEIIPDGNPGKISDVAQTEETGIIRQVPFGHTLKTDKGFLIDNQAAAEGCYNDRPPKRQRKQVQQSAEDTGCTQNKGNLRITVENVNGGVKNKFRFLLDLVKCLQFGTISKVVRIGYLMQNFSKPIIQNHNYASDGQYDNGLGRPCRGEIRIYGATDAGLRDMRPVVHLWGSKCEIDLHRQLSVEHQNKAPVDISEMVYNQRLEVKLRRELYQLHGKEYTGDI